jgi:hypothetical protein
LAADLSHQMAVSSKKIQHWLILSHGFNMDGRAASQTITDKLPYLLDAGIQLHVLSAITGIKDTRFPHEQLIAWGPAAFRFDFRHWFANRFGRGIAYKIFTPLISVILSPFIAIEKILAGYSSQWSWAFPAYFAGLRLIKQGRIDLIYSTGGAWSAHLAALWLKKKTKLPWIVEIHDPLVIRSNEKDSGKEAPKKPDARKRHSLEQEICKYADIAWWFTDGALHFAKQRNPTLDQPGHAKGLMIIPGANPPDMEAVIQDIAHHYGEYLNICHFGSLASNRSMTQVLECLPGFFSQYPDARNKIRFHIYGAQLDTKSKEYVRIRSYQNNVIEHGRLEKDSTSGLTGRQQIAMKMQEADILLLLHGNSEWCREYIPSKLYDYFWTNRPIWGLVYKNPQLEYLLQSRLSYMSKADHYESVLETIKAIYTDWKERKLPQQSIKAISVESAVKEILNQVAYLKQPDQYEY